MFVITHKDGIKINADVNAKNWLTKEFTFISSYKENILKQRSFECNPVEHINGKY